MKDFDAVRNERPRRTVEERTFRLGGETFVARDRFRPEAIAPLEAVKDPKVDPTTCRCGHRLHEHLPFADGRKGAAGCGTAQCDCEQFSPVIIEGGTPLAEQLVLLDATMVALIEAGDDAHGRYRAIRERVEDPLEVADLMAVIKWVTEVDTGRPTGAPDGLPPGREATAGTSSTPASSSPETIAA